MKVLTGLFNILVIMGSLSFSPSCSSIRQISGNGNVGSETRRVDPFTRVDCSGNFHIFLTQENVPDLRIEADKNLLPYIISDIKDGGLVIKEKDNVNLTPTRPINVYLSIKNMDALGVSHACRLQSQNTLRTDALELSASGAAGMNVQLKTESLKVHLSGRAKMNIKGTATFARYHISGSADVMANDLATDSAEAHISGSGELHMNVQERLEASISGSGKIAYKGDPEIEKSISGAGKIIRE